MPTIVSTVLGVLILIVAVLGLFSGKMIVGSRGHQVNYYAKEDDPFLYYSFTVFTLLIGFLILYNSI